MEPREDDAAGDSQFSDLEQRFFDLSIDMLAVLGVDGYFKRLNHAWETTLGFTPAEMMSRPFIDFVHPDDRERTLSQNRDVRGGGRAALFENRYLCIDGSYKWMLWNARRDPDRQMIYAVARDMTARKQAEAEREQLVRELREALAEVKALQSFLPICSYCKRIRNDQNYWQSVEGYISAHTNTQFSHSICPECFETRVDPAFKDGL
jgi:PAS domain S-box-containing protein